MLIVGCNGWLNCDPTSHKIKSDISAESNLHRWITMARRFHKLFHGLGDHADFGVIVNELRNFRCSADLIRFLSGKSFP